MGTLTRLGSVPHTGQKSMKSLELKVPPLIIVCVCALAMFGISRLFGKQRFLAGHGDVIGFVFIVAGILVAVAGIVAFRKARTTVNPLRNENIAALVTSGIYSMTRNPMYVGMLLLLTGFGLLLSSLYSLVMCVVFVLYINRFQIQPEEKMLESIFKNDYVLYKARVRRWV